MDPVRNPFAPGAGSQPPELAGRDEIISTAGIALQRVLRGKHDKSQIFLGLRGTGKTVLLNKIEQLAESHLAENAYVNETLRKIDLLSTFTEKGLQTATAMIDLFIAAPLGPACALS